jgi:hypothetical protein
MMLPRHSGEETPMSETDYEAYLRLLSRFLRLSARQRAEIRRELRAHLEEAIDDDIARGVPREEAILRALDDFGDAAELAARFCSIGRRRRWIMRGTMAAACIGFVALALTALTPNSVSTVIAEPGDDGMAPVRSSLAASADDPRADEILAALHRELPEVTFEDAPFEAIIDYLGELLQINIHVEWQRLEDAGVARDAPVTVNLRKISAARLLELVLGDAGGDVDLGYEMRHGVLVFSTREALMEHLSTRMYDVRDLLNMPPDGGASADVEDLSEQLTELILNVVEPDSWQPHGGSGYLQVFNGVLVVRQFDSAQREIQTLIDSLRATGAVPGD